MTEPKAEQDSLIRRMQGMEANIHVSMSKFDLRLQELEAVRLKSSDSDGADTATGKPTMQQSIGIQSDIDGGEKVRCRDAKVEHDGGDRWTHSSEWAHSNEPSEATVGASRLMGRGGSTTRGGGKAQDWWDKYYDWAEQAGINRRDRPTEVNNGASRSKGRGGEKIRGGDKTRGRWGK